MAGTIFSCASTERFVFRQVDWEFYQRTLNQLSGRRAFVTYFNGTLELATVSFWHYRVSRLLLTIVWTLADESDIPIVSAGSATFCRRSCEAGLEPDESFYVANANAVVKKRELDVTLDPPPDLALEVEVTRRLGQRTEIYRELRVPEVWRFSDAGLQVLLRDVNEYHIVDKSPTFPWLAPAEITQFVELGLTIDETAWARKLRDRIREAIAAHNS
jgi:Uma2 family endonuclease